MTRREQSIVIAIGCELDPAGVLVDYLEFDYDHGCAGVEVEFNYCPRCGEKLTKRKRKFRDGLEAHEDEWGYNETLWSINVNGLTILYTYPERRTILDTWIQLDRIQFWAILPDPIVRMSTFPVPYDYISINDGKQIDGWGRVVGAFPGKEAEVRNALEPLGLWDAKKYGLYVLQEHRLVTLTEEEVAAKKSHPRSDHVHQVAS